MDYNKIYDLDDSGVMKDPKKERNNSKLEELVGLPSVSLEEANDEVLKNLVNAARVPGADPKIQAQALDALYKRKYGEIDVSNAHDIREIMNIMCEDCMKKLEEKCK